MKVGDLVKFTNRPHDRRLFLVTEVWGLSGVSLCAFRWNQVFDFSQVEVVSNPGREEQ